MAKVRVSFSAALFGLSFVICLIVALFFVDRKRNEDEDLAKSGSPQTAADLSPVSTHEAALASTTALQPGAGASPESAQERPAMLASQQQAPVLQMSSFPNNQPGQNSAMSAGNQGPAQSSQADLPMDPRFQRAITEIPHPAPAQVTPYLSAQQYASISPESLAKQLQGQTNVPMGVQGQAPELALPEGLPASRASRSAAAPVRTAVPQAKVPYPIQSNASGVAGAMKTLPANSPFSSVPGVPSSVALDGPHALFKAKGVVSTQQLRNALADQAQLDPVTLKPLESQPEFPATNTSSSTWEAIGPGDTAGGQALIDSIPAPSVSGQNVNQQTYIIKNGQTHTGQPASPSGALASSVAPPTPLQASSPSVTGAKLYPLESNSGVPPPPGGSGSTPAAGGLINKYNLPPAPQLPISGVQPVSELAPESNSGPLDDLAKQTALPPMIAGGGQQIGSGLDAVSNASIGKPEAAEGKATAKVNDQILTEDDNERRAKVLSEIDGKPWNEDTGILLRKQSAELWTQKTALAELARREQVSVGENEISSLTAKIAGYDPDKWSAAMRKAGFSDEEIRNELKDMALGQKLVEQRVKSAYDEAKLREAYEKNPGKFVPTRSFHVMEIYKRRPEDPAQIKSLEKDLQGLQRQAAGGADFGLLASQASEGPSRAKGGDLGWLDSVSDLNEPMAKALGDLKPGQVSNVVPAADGFRIYKLVEVKEPQSGFEGARELVESSVMEQFRTAAFAEAEKSCDISLPHGKKSRTVASPVRPTRANRSEDDVRRVQADSSRSTGASNGGNRITVRKSGQNGALGKSNMLSAAKEPPAGSMAVIDMNSMRPVGRQSPGDITTQATGSTADSVVAGPAGFGGSGFRPTSQATNGQMVASQESASKSRNPISNFISGFRKPATPQR